MAGGVRDRPAPVEDVTTITLSYTFFEVGGKIPSAPPTAAADCADTGGWASGRKQEIVRRRAPAHLCCAPCAPLPGRSGGAQCRSARCDQESLRPPQVIAVATGGAGPGSVGWLLLMALVNWPGLTAIIRNDRSWINRRGADISIQGAATPYYFVPAQSSPSGAGRGGLFFVILAPPCGSTATTGAVFVCGFGLLGGWSCCPVVSRGGARKRVRPVRAQGRPLTAGA